MLGPFTYLSLFTGAGGGDLACQHLLGWRCLGYVEIDEYCQKVIAQRIKDGFLNEAPIFTDIRTFISDGYAASYQGMVDVVTGGFPCQDISSAGSMRGINGKRSSLWRSMAEVVRQARPKFALVENSPMLTIRGLGDVLRELAEMRRNARWKVFSACEFGAPHTRERLFAVSNAECDRRRAGSSLMGWAWGNLQNEKRNASAPRQDGKQFRREVARCNWWNSEPDVGRVANGLAYGVDRLRAIGNGQVPIMAATAWEILSQ
ncbi:DNA cytosine methyltransferase [Candidatus Parcubacteria bacterium]|nr:MAG: DNA cytosine methyltransferase [Candidatus Parcubacteria bacterium]